jgi:hypothetical protein
VARYSGQVADDYGERDDYQQDEPRTPQQVLQAARERHGVLAGVKLSATAERRDGTPEGRAARVALLILLRNGWGAQ